MIILPSLVGLFYAAVAWTHPLAGVESTAIELGRRTTVTAAGSGTVDGYFYHLFAEYNRGVILDIGTGNYSMTWSPATGDVVGGIGRSPANTDPISYSGTFDPVGNSYLSVYGFTVNPAVEYWICEKFGTYNPSTGFTYMGNVSSDGSIYDIYRTVRVPLPSGGGLSEILYQYISVRQSQRVGGTVTLANHFNAWKSLGMTMGSLTYQIVASEGYYSSGSSQISVYL